MYGHFLGVLERATVGEAGGDVRRARGFHWDDSPDKGGRNGLSWSSIRFESFSVYALQRPQLRKTSMR